MDARAGGSEGRKSLSVTADKEGPQGRHGACKQRAKNGGQQYQGEAEPLVVGGNSGGSEASGVDPETHKEGGEEGRREASGVEENPRGGARSGRGV